MEMLPPPSDPSAIDSPRRQPIEIAASIHRTLHQAARDGDVRVMRYLLDRLGGQVHRRINQLDEDELSPLHYAARYNLIDMVVLLVERGADVNIKGEDGLTPLHFAARYKKTKTVRVFSGESIDQQSEAEESGKPAEERVTSPLSSPDGAPGVYQRFMNFAAHKKPLLYRGMLGDSKDQDRSPDSASNTSLAASVVLFLAWQGADVSNKDNFGLTPLHYAAMRGNDVAARELLMCKGIYIEARDRQRMTPLHLAAIHNSVGVVGILIDADASLRSIDETLSTPLHRASMEGNLEVVSLLLEAADKDGGWVSITQMVSDLDSAHNLPLHLAIDNDHVDIVRLLIGKGSDTNIARQNFVFPLHLAAVAGNEDIIDLLIQNTARVDCLNASQETPLHRAAEYNQTAAIEILLLNGAKIDRRDKDNCTPLLIAAAKGHLAAIQCLLQHGADIGAVEKNDKTSIYLATEGNSYEALPALVSHGSKELLDRSDRYGNTPLHIAAKKGYLNIVQFLLDEGGIIDQKNEEEQTPLHLAAEEGRTKVVRELLKRSKQLANNEDEDSNTPLHLASLTGNDKVIRILLEAGANIESRNSSQQWTALDCACAKGWIRSVRVLLDAGSTVEPHLKIRTTPLHLAASRGHVTVVQLLMERGAKVSRRDDLGRNSLDIAIEDSQQCVATAIIGSHQWQDALRNYTICPKTGARRTPLRRLIRKLPDVAEQVFKQCISTNSFPREHPNFTVTFNYEYLDDTYIVDTEQPTYNDSVMSSRLSIYDEDFRVKREALQYDANATLIKENHPLTIMVYSKQKKLLGHPLCMSLVQYKWLRFGRYVYYTNLLFYAFFLTFLTGYLLTTTPPNEGGQAVISDNSTNLTVIATLIECAAVSDVITQNLFASIGKRVIMILCGINLLKECFQIFQVRFRYMSIENLLEWMCYISAILLVIDFSDCAATTGIREVWQWELGAFSIFLAWLDLVMFIRKFPFLGIYVVMFTDVFTTFVKVFAVFFLLIIGFGLSFSTLFYNQETMPNAGKTLLRTSVMMLGEFNFDDMFADENIWYPAPSYVIFAVFVILMPIITMNLLVGLAVDDIKGVQEQAELKRLAMQVELVLNVESVLPAFLRRQFVVYQHSIRPNKQSRSYFKNLLSSLDLQEVVAAYYTHVESKPESTKMEAQHDAILSRMTHVEKAMQELQADTRRIKSLLLALAEEKGLALEDEDGSAGGAIQA